MIRTQNTPKSRVANTSSSAMPFVPRNEALRLELSSHWSRLTEHDLRAIELDPSQIVPRLQVAYGYARDDAEQASREFRSKYVAQDADLIGDD
jgi:hypothetical protein